MAHTRISRGLNGILPGLLLAIGGGCQSDARHVASDSVTGQDHLRAMSRTLAAARAFSFRAEITAEEWQMDNGGRRLGEFRRHIWVRVRRPNGLAVDSDENSARTLLRYDGRQLGVWSGADNTYAMVQAPETIDAVLAYVQNQYDVSMPLAVLLDDDPYPVLTASNPKIVYAGMQSVEGRACHHVVLTEPLGDYHFWLDAGPTRLPWKTETVYTGMEGMPKRCTVFTGWNLDARFSKDEFSFKPPAGARPTNMNTIIRP